MRKSPKEARLQGARNGSPKALIKIQRTELDGVGKGGATVGAVGAAAPTGARQWGQDYVFAPTEIGQVMNVFWRFRSKAVTISGEKQIFEPLTII